MKKNQPKVEHYIYARKSSESDEKQVESIPRQIDIANELAAHDGVVIPDDHIFKEERSAKIPGRQVFGELMARVEQNEHTTIYGWIFNRLSRNSKDDGWVRHLIEIGKLTVIVSDKKFDKSTNSIVTAVEGAQGTQYSRDLGKMVTDSNENRRKRGIYPGQPPPGYKWEGPRGQMRHTPDGERFTLLQKALHLVLKGEPPAQVLRILNGDWGYTTPKKRRLGGGPLAEATWYDKVLKNPFYCGHFVCNQGKPNEKHYTNGVHKAMITEAEYWRIQEILGERGRPRPQQHIAPPYLGLLHCGECGASITHEHKVQVRCLCKKKYSAKHQKKCPHCGLHESKVPIKRKHEYDFYRCTKQLKDKKTKKPIKCSQPYIPTAELEKQLSALLVGLTHIQLQNLAT